MKKRLTRIAPLRAGIVVTIICAILGVIASPYFFFGGLSGTKGDSSLAGNIGAAALMAILAPICYAVMGFLGGIVVAVLYNLIVRWTGGLVFEVADIPPA